MCKESSVNIQPFFFFFKVCSQLCKHHLLTHTQFAHSPLPHTLDSHTGYAFEWSGVGSVDETGPGPTSLGDCNALTTPRARPPPLLFSTTVFLSLFFFFCFPYAFILPDELLLKQQLGLNNSLKYNALCGRRRVKDCHLSHIIFMSPSQEVSQHTHTHRPHCLGPSPGPAAVWHRGAFLVFVELLA